MHGAPFLYPNIEDPIMTEEYKIIEEEQEYEVIMAEALKVGENITAIVNYDGFMWGITMEELLDGVPHKHLLEYSLTVMEGMGLIAHTDLDDPIWDEYECGFNDDKERFRAKNRMDPSWKVLRGEGTNRRTAESKSNKNRIR